MKYIEISKLIEFCLSNKARVKKLTNNNLANNSSFPEVELSLQDQKFTFFVDDEYEDLNIKSNLLSVCIALRALESYDYAEDYLVWCKQHNFDAANMQVRDHFQNLGDVVAWFSKEGIKVFSFISDYDFELNAGAALFLRNNPKLDV